MNVLVTGAAGFIGSHLAERLVTLGHTVRGLDCLTDFYSNQLKNLNLSQLQTQGIDVSLLDLVSGNLADAVADIDIVFHLAAQPGLSSTTPFDTYVRNNLIATHQLLNVLEKSSTLKLFVNVSTSSVYGADATRDETTLPKPTSTYGVTKLAAEQLALAFQREGSVPVCSMRLFSVYGPRERPEKLYPKLIESILSKKKFPLREGSKIHERSYTYIDDAVNGLTATLDHCEQCVGEIFNIGTDICITTGEGIDIVENIIGQKALISNEPRRTGDQLKTHANISKARRILGYNPTTSAEDGLRNEVEWYQENIFEKIDLWS